MPAWPVLCSCGFAEWSNLKLLFLSCPAVPMTLGQEFNSFASTIAAELGFLEQVAQRFYTCNMGGTAIGTGIAATTGYSRACVQHLR